MRIDFRNILMVLAIMCFVLSAIPVSTLKWDRLIPTGLAFWALAVLVGAG